jgi:OOP family OmpA-OmpF porin
LIQKDPTQGFDIPLGGSMAFNLADAASMLGLGNDHLDRYKIVYQTFGDILSKMYPEIMATYPEYSKVIDKSFLASVISNHPELLEGKALQVQYAEKITSTISSKSYQIQFQSGSAIISTASSEILEEILKSAVVAEGLKVGVYGHTDNVGNPQSNQILSEKRAQSVKVFLMSKGLPGKEIEVQGFGDAQPIADNSTPAGKAKNRRVQIVLGQ